VPPNTPPLVQALSPDEDAALNHSILSLLQTADNYLETYSPKASGKSLEPPGAALPAPKNPVSSPCSDALLSSFLFYAPIALNFIYSPDPLELQLLAAQLGWSTLYAHLDMGKLGDSHQAYALLLHRQRKVRQARRGEAKRSETGQCPCSERPFRSLNKPRCLRAFVKNGVTRLSRSWRVLNLSLRAF